MGHQPLRGLIPRNKQKTIDAKALVVIGTLIPHLTKGVKDRWGMGIGPEGGEDLSSRHICRTISALLYSPIHRDEA